MKPSARATDLVLSLVGCCFLAGAGLAILVGGCSRTESPSGDAGPRDAGNVDVGAAGALYGTFQVKLIAPVPAVGTSPAVPGYTSIVGKAADGPAPSGTIWEEEIRDGDCRLLTPRVPFCAVPCGGSAVCVEDDQCQPYPTTRSLGTVHLSGVTIVVAPTGTGGSGGTGGAGGTGGSGGSAGAAGGNEIALVAVAGTYQLPGGVSAPFPGFPEGGVISLTTSGGDFPSVSVEARGIAPLALLSDTITLAQDQPLTLAWTPPGQSSLARILVKLDISHHGGSRGMIECDADDTGSLTIGASLVTQLLALGVSGFPTVVVTRQAVGSAALTSGRFDLVVSSQVEKDVAIPGLVSCNEDADCPASQTCQVDLRCQ